MKQNQMNQIEMKRHASKNVFIAMHEHKLNHIQIASFSWLIFIIFAPIQKVAWQIERFLFSKCEYFNFNFLS